MIALEKTNVSGWDAAIRGMRNPKNSWKNSDSGYKFGFYIGHKDLTLMRTLAHAGTDHGKFLRMINVTVDITAPLYWWKEFDTYKVGTVADSCSTMHKIHDKEFDRDDFSYEHLSPLSLTALDHVINVMNRYRDEFIAGGDKDAWWQMIQLLPSSYNQKRTVQLNYAVLLNQYHARKNHKLDEWHIYCDWIRGLPYFKEICLEEE